MARADVAYEDYTEAPMGDGTGATLVCYHEHGHSWPIAVSHGIFDAVTRAMEAHRLHVRAHAARQAVLMQDGAVQAWLARLGGRSHRLSVLARGMDKAERRDEEERLIAGLVAGRDPYRATRAVEEEYRVDGDQGLYEAVATLVARAREEARSPPARAAGARALADAAPSTSALARHRDGLHGRAAPAKGPVVAPSRVGSYAVCLGTALVAPKVTPPRPRQPGEAPFTGEVEVTATVTFDPSSMEFEPDGAIAFADVDLAVRPDPALWLGARDGLLYYDDATLAAVNGLIAAAGLKGSAGWSELGRQTAEEGDMDLSYETVEGLWPGIVAERREAAMRAAATAGAPSA